MYLLDVTNTTDHIALMNIYPPAMVEQLRLDQMNQNEKDLGAK